MARECGLSEIAELPLEAPIQRQIVDSFYTYYKPIGPVVGSTEIEFNIKNNSETFIDLSNSEVETIFRVKKANGANLASTDKVTVINYIAATMFNTVVCMLGNVQVTERTPNQAFRAIVETLTTYGRDAVESWLQSGLFFKDTAGQMDNADPAPANGTDPVNVGLKQRFDLTKESKRVAVRGRIHTDMCNQARPLINFVPISLKFHLNKNAYCLMSAEEDASYKIVIEDMSLRLRHIKLVDQVYNSIVTKRVVYPITRVKVKEYIIPQGGKSFNVANFVMGELPEKIIIGLVTNEAANGNYKLNPFNFQHFDLSEISLVVNGSVHGGAPLEFDFADNQFEQGYWELFAATGKKYRDEGMLIERNDYQRGSTLYAFNISPTLCNGQYKDPERSGNINIACKFKENIPSPLTLCAYLQFEGAISINPAKQVTSNFQT